MCGTNRKPQRQCFLESTSGTINLGLVKDNQIVHKITVPSFAPDATLKETLQHFENAIKQIVTPEVTKIGIGVPTYVDSEKGIVYDAMNIPSWTVIPLKERLEKAFNKHTIIPAYHQHLSSRPRHRNSLYRHR